MNSKQKRKERRKWPISAKSRVIVDDWVQTQEIIDWLNTYIGRGRWKKPDGYRFWDNEFLFTRQEDATLFLLKWR